MNKGLAQSLEELIGIAEACHEIYEPLLTEREAVATAKERLAVFNGEAPDRRAFNIGYNQQEK